MKRVVTFGEVMLRLEPAGFGRLLQAVPGNLRATFAGAEANVAAAVCNLGGSAEVVTAVSRNKLSEALLRELHGLGILTDRIKQIEGSRLGLFFTERGANQRPSTVTYDRAHSALATTPGNAYDWDAAFSGAGWFHTTGITPAVSENAAEAAVAAVTAARAAGLTVSVDLNFRSSLWRWKEGVSPRELARKVMPEIVRHCDLLIGNEADAFDVLDIAPPDSDVERGRLSHAAYTDVARRIAQSYTNLRRIAFTLRESVSATHNRWGAMLYSVDSGSASFAPTADGIYRPYEITSIVDRVGAGDSFAGGLIYSLHSGMTDLNALEFGTAFSCLAHSIEGDINYSSRDDVERMIASSGSGRVQR